MNFHANIVLSYDCVVFVSISEFSAHNLHFGAKYKATIKKMQKFRLINFLFQTVIFLFLNFADKLSIYFVFEKLIY